MISPEPGQLPVRPNSARKGATARNQTIDVIRGAALIAIFCDHLRPNFWNAFTPRGLGFSDFAEVFVFLSGYLNAAVFDRVLADGGFAALFLRVRRRLRILYSAHLVTFALKLLLLYALIALGSSYRDAALEAAWHRPWEHFAKTLLFLYMPGDLSVLPLYFVLIAIFPLILVALTRAPRRTVAVSCLLWALAQFHVLQSRSMVEETAWYFHPLAWQLVFVAGAALRIHPQIARFPLFSRPTVVRFATVVLFVVAGLKLAYRFAPQMFAASLGRFQILLADDFRKSTLNPLRPAYFACVLIALGPWVFRRQHGFSASLARCAAACGKHSLLVFCSTIIAGLLANVALAATEHATPLFELAVLIAGAALLLAVGQLAEVSARKRERRVLSSARQETQAIRA